MATSLTEAEKIAWSYLDGNDIYGDGPLRKWAVQTVELVQEFVEEGNSAGQLAEVIESAVPYWANERLEIVACSTTLATWVPETEPADASPSSVARAVLYEVATDLVNRAYLVLVSDTITPLTNTD